MKERIQKLIDIYATYVFGVDRDAGWHAPSQLEAIIAASMAKSSGSKTKALTARVSAGEERQGNDSSNDKMVNEIRFVRNKHYDFELAKMLFSKLEDKQLLALVGGVYLRYVYKRVHSESEIAEYFEVTKAVYRHNKKIGLRKVEGQLVYKDELKDLEHLKIA